LSCRPVALRLATWLLVAFVAVATTFAPARAAGQDTLEIASKSGVHIFSVEIANTDAERERGLMYRKQMAADHGMLFDFQRDQPVSFWMHNTYIPLDMVFIASDGRIVRIAENAKPMSDDLIPSVLPIRAVLEINGGVARSLGIAVGDRVGGSIFGKAH
jgi:uncharacterized membrane protein (UPF0127 family)